MKNPSNYITEYFWVAVIRNSNGRLPEDPKDLKKLNASIKHDWRNGEVAFLVKTNPGGGSWVVELVQDRMRNMVQWNIPVSLLSGKTREDLFYNLKNIVLDHYGIKDKTNYYEHLTP